VVFFTFGVFSQPQTQKILLRQGKR